MQRSSQFILITTFLLLVSSVFSQASVKVNAFATSCNESVDGKIVVSVESEKYPSIVKVFNVKKKVLVQSLIFNSKSTLEITNLEPGHYDVKKYMDSKVNDSIRIEITKPKGLENSKILVGKLSDSENSCNGKLIAKGVGGTPPYNYKWKHIESTDARLENVCWGTYTCYVNDANNCGPVKADIPFSEVMKEYFEYETNKSQ